MSTDYLDTMSKAIRPMWWPITFAASFAAFMVSRYATVTLGVPVWATLVAALCVLVVSGVVGTRRELRRREAAAAAAGGIADAAG